MFDAEDRVAKYYTTRGWELSTDDVTDDARRWEDLRECARDYVSNCRRRVMRYIPETGENILDMASGPIQYPEYLEYSKNYKKRYCVDLSSQALEQAKKKIGKHGEFIEGSFLSMPLNSEFFDCTISLHTIYHIDKDQQEEAVRKLLTVTKQGRPVIIVYCNPRSIAQVLLSVWPIRILRKLLRTLARPQKNDGGEDANIYFHPHPLAWWDRFRDAADVQILPWRSFHADVQKMLIPNNRLGIKMFDLLFRLEERFPACFVRWGYYNMIVMKKKSAHSSS